MYKGFELIKTTNIPEINADFILYKHKKTGAEVAYLKNSDIEKSFTITFPTIEHNSTGVAHILEHSVLSGSEKYDLKEVFGDLRKFTVASFLNAFTSTEFTMYPFASTNSQDYLNLLDVYLDAVFFPKLKKEVFLTEGWHIDLANKENPNYSGIVYNEMKGVLSNFGSIIRDRINNAAFKDTIYAYEYGGDPKEIPTLTYDAFKKFHKKWYHPSLSKTFVYGDLDIESVLTILDETFSRFDPRAQVILNENVTPLKDKVVTDYFECESPDDKNAVGIGILTPGISKIESKALSILVDALVSAEESALKKISQTKLTSGIAIGDYDYQKIEPIIYLSFEDVKEKDIPAIHNEISERLKLSIDNLSVDMVEAELNSYEFLLREEVIFSGYPKGISYAFIGVTEWLLGRSPVDELSFEDDLSFLKNKLVNDFGYFKELLYKYVLNNSNKVTVNIIKKPLSEESLNVDKPGNITDENKKDFELLSKYRKEEEDQNAADCLPKIKISDIPREIQYQDFSVEEPSKKIFLKKTTKGINYLSLAYEVPNDNFSNIGLLLLLLTKLNTQNYSYENLNNLITKDLGDLSFDSYATKEKFYLLIETKFLQTNTPNFLHVLEELKTTKFDDLDRIREIVEKVKAKLKHKLLSSGHQVALTGSASVFSNTYKNIHASKLLGFYEFLREIVIDDTLAASLEKLCTDVFSRSPHIGLCAERDFYEELAPIFKVEKSELEIHKGLVSVNTENCAYYLDSSVNYVGYAIKYKNQNKGAAKVLARILSTDYLWKKIRLEEGAYGVFSSFISNESLMLFATYRDPNTSKSLDIMKKSFTEQMVQIQNMSDAKIEEYVVGTIGLYERHMSFEHQLQSNFRQYLFGITTSEIQHVKDQILGTTKQDLLNEIKLLSESTQTNVFALGNQERLKQLELPLHKV